MRRYQGQTTLFEVPVGPITLRVDRIDGLNAYFVDGVRVTVNEYIRIVDRLRKDRENTKKPQ